MQTAYEFFVNELRDLLNCENRLVHALGEQERECAKEQLRETFRHHRKQTEQQAERLMDIFRELGETPEQAECYGIMGLIEEKETFLKKDPSHELLDFFNVAAGIKAERYEISAYDTLLLLAREMGMQRAATLIQQTLAEEREALEKLEGLLREVKPIELGVKEPPEGGVPRRAA